MLTAQELSSVSDGGTISLGTTSDPIARNLLKNHDTLIRERGEHAGFIGFGIVEVALAAGADGKSKDAILPVCLKRATLAKSAEIVKAKVGDDEEWFPNPLLGHVVPFLANQDFSKRAKSPESFVSWLRVQLGNRVRIVKPEAFVGLFSSQQMVIQGRFKDHRVRQGLAQNPAIRAKLQGIGDPPKSSRDATDEGIEDLGMVLPCDDSQLRVVQRANGQESMIVEGPPGTGKSQTITNIIGNALWRGRNVLFVCEKRTAVSQVEERLVQSGIGGALLNLHDEDLDKSDFLLRATTSVVSRSYRPRNVRPQLEELSEIRKILNDRVRHGRNTTHASMGIENREALAGLIRLRQELGNVPTLSISNWQGLSRERLNKLLGIIGSWEQLAPVLSNAGSIWNKIKPEAFDGFPNSGRECEAGARSSLAVLERCDQIHEQNAEVGLDDALTSRNVAEEALAVAQLVMNRPACHPLVIGNRSLTLAELADLRDAAERQGKIRAQNYPVNLEVPTSEPFRADARTLLKEEGACSWDDLRAAQAVHNDRATLIEAIDREYDLFARQIGLRQTPGAKVRIGQLRGAIELAEAECHIPREWWHHDKAPMVAVGGWKRQLNECRAHVKAAPHPIQFSAIEGLSQSHWSHLEAMAENSFNLVSYCVRFVNDRKCKFALKQMYPGVSRPKAEEWERLAVHAMTARRIANGLTESGKTHTVLTQITIDYLATAHNGDGFAPGKTVSKVERTAELVERWRGRNDWFEVEAPHWQSSWEARNPRVLAEAQKLLSAHEALLHADGPDDIVPALAALHRQKAERIRSFLAQTQAASGNFAHSVEASFAAQDEYGRCGQLLLAFEKYTLLQAEGQSERGWDSIEKILRWRDAFESHRGSRRLDLDNRAWGAVVGGLREHVAAVNDVESIVANYFNVVPSVDVPDYATLREMLASVVAGIPSMPLWLEKRKWSQKMKVYPEISALWTKITAGTVQPSHGQQLFCFNLLLNCSPDPEPAGHELVQAVKSFKEKDELLASWSVEELKQRLQQRFEAAQRQFQVEFGRLSTLLSMQRRPAVRQMINNDDKYRFTDYLLAAKPCWMMSPVALANLLDSAAFDGRGVPFDLV
jgi:hypothetical protein